MNKAHAFIDKYLYFLNNHKFKLLPVIMGFMVFLFVMCFQTTIDLSTEGMLFKDDPILLQYVKFQQVYGNDNNIIITATGDVFSNDFLTKIYNLQKDIDENLPYVKNTTSIINISQLYTSTDETGASSLYVDDLLKDYPNKLLSEDELQRLKTIVMTDPVFSNQVVSTDGRSSAIIVELYTKSEVDRLAQLETTETSDSELGSFDEFDDLFSDENIDLSLEDDINNADVESDTEEETIEYVSTYLDSHQENEVYEELLAIDSRHESEGFEVAMAGGVLFLPTMLNAMFRDAKILLPGLLLMIMVFIIVMFRRASALMFTMMIAGFTNIFVFGMMGVVRIPISLTSNIIPTTMISIGIGAIIHLLVLVYGKFDNGLSKVEALQYAFKHSSWPIILTGITSAAGLFSFYFSALKPMRDFGLFSALGLTYSLVLTLFLVPLLILTLPIKRKKLKHIDNEQAKNKQFTKFDFLLSKHASIAYKGRIVTLLFTVVLIGLSILAVKDLQFSHRPLEWLPTNSQFKEDTYAIDKVMQGSNGLEIFIDTKVDGGVYEPEFLQKMETIAEYLYNYESPYVKVGKVLSLNTILKKTNRVLNQDDEAFYILPDSRELVAQELLLLENGGAESLNDFVDINYRYYRMTMRLPDLDAIHFTKLLDELAKEMDRIFEKDNYSYYTTGGVALLTQVVTSTIESARNSYFVAFIVITILMVLLTGKIKIGLISMIPNILPIFVLLGIVGVTAINLDMFVMLIGCILLGIAVDNTIHFIHVYRQAYKEGLDAEESIRQTFLTTGKAMLTSSIILIAGFSVLIFGELRNFHYFGVLAVLGVIIALFSDFFLTPVLMIYLSKWGIVTRENTKTKTDT